MLNVEKRIICIKKEHHASMLFKIGGNSLSGTSRLEIYDVKKK